jgi:hypothetical protein
MAPENMKHIWKGSQLLVESLVFLFQQKKKGQGQKLTESTPSVDLANTKLSVMKMQKMLGELAEGKGKTHIEANPQCDCIGERVHLLSSVYILCVF